MQNLHMIIKTLKFNKPVKAKWLANSYVYQWLKNL